MSKSNLNHQGFDDGMSVHEAAFKELAQSIGHCILEEGRAYDMSSLLLKYRDILKERGIDGASYTKHRLKERLKRYIEHVTSNFSNKPTSATQKLSTLVPCLFMIL